MSSRSCEKSLMMSPHIDVFGVREYYEISPRAQEIGELPNYGGKLGR